MPIYEYKCKKCNNEFDLLLYSKETPICPKCSNKDLIKKISLFSTSCKSDGEGFFSKSSSSSKSNNKSCGSCSGGSCSTCR